MKQILLFFFVFSVSIPLFAQTNRQKEQTIAQKAHDKQLLVSDFVPTKNQKFKLKTFNIEEPKINKKHHWFLQLLTPNNEFVNYATIEVKGHLKNNPSIHFKYIGSVMRMCTEGKYIIGFVKVDQPGTYVLKVNIANFGVSDETSVEINIPNRLYE